MIRDLFSVATLRALAAHTPAPVPTYPLPLAPRVPHTYDTFGDAVHPPLLLVITMRCARWCSPRTRR